MRTPFVQFIAVVSLSTHASSFSVEPAIGRRQLLSGAFVAASASVGGVRPSVADVSDGNALPQGAAQFSRVLKIKSDLSAVGKRVSEHGDEIDSKEWDNIGGFLRKLYATGQDMNAVAETIYDPEKKKKAEENVKLVQKYAQAGDVSVNKQDAQKFLAICKLETELIDEFFELLSDVPDEI